MSSDLQRRMEEDAAKSSEFRKQVVAAFHKTGAPPVEAQVAFLKGLMENRAEADKFMKNPKQYCLEHGIVLSPEVVQLVVRNVITDQALDRDIVGRYGEKVAGLLLDMRLAGAWKAIPAAAAAAAAAVMAAAAVVTAVVTLVRTKRPDDIRVLVGLGPDGIRLPSGVRLDIRTMGSGGSPTRGPR